MKMREQGDKALIQSLERDLERECSRRIKAEAQLSRIRNVFVDLLDGEFQRAEEDD